MTIKNLISENNNITYHQALLKEAQDVAKIGHWELDNLNNNLFWSEQIFKIFETEPNNKKLTYEHFLKFVHPDDRELVNSAYKKSLIQKTPYNIEHRILLDNNRIKYVHEQCKTDYDKKGMPTRSFGTVQDITERKLMEIELTMHKNKLETLVVERTKELDQKNKDLINSNIELCETNKEIANQKKILEDTIQSLNRTQAQLIQSEKMASIGLLTAGMAHEINNPVNFIISGVYGLKNFINAFNSLYSQAKQIITDEVPDKIDCIENLEEELDFKLCSESVDKTIQNISIGADRIANIVKGLRNFSSKNVNEEHFVNINDSINDSLLLLNHELKYKAQVIKNFEKIPNIKCYPGKINQAFMNLIINAAQAIKNNGVITIKTWKDSENNNICISIKDNGCGIKKELQNKIFEPFFTTKENGMGMGLGLYITHNIVKEHNGNLKLISEENNGAEFIITLPIN